jgi:hypothetical protein
LPRIIKQKSVQPDGRANRSNLRSTKTFLSKQEERILDIQNIPEVNQIYGGLEHKYERIKKLKEEFNEIKTQFGITIPPKTSAADSSIIPKRSDILTRSTVYNRKNSVEGKNPSDEKEKT